MSYTVLKRREIDKTTIEMFKKKSPESTEELTLSFLNRKTSVHMVKYGSPWSWKELPKTKLKPGNCFAFLNGGRIENLKLPGIESGEWNITTRFLALIR